ncbi:MAG: hypothetical protein E7399_08575 [Ruminococcaceae bacterium]|nr:hypothetical protein [Oscillospiraceae bacterium]
MKRLLALLLAGMMVFSLTACGGADNEIEIDEPIGEETKVVESINMTYGDDEVQITLNKPENAEFTLGSDTPDDAGDLVGLCADDYSWDAEVMGYKYYEGIGSNVPFVDYYFAGAVNEEKYASYEEKVTETSIEYEGKPVQIIRYTYQETDSDEVYSECFVGFEYKGTADEGMFGLKIFSDEELSDEMLEGLFKELIVI